MKIVADTNIPFLKGVLEPYAEVVYMDGRSINREAMMDADAIVIRTRTRCCEETLRGTKVKMIASATIGTDHIDLQWCRENGIEVKNAEGCNAGAVANYIFSAMYAVTSRRAIKMEDAVLGIVGVGNVGRKVEHMARTLGLKVLLNDPPRAALEGEEGFVNIDTLLSEATIISIHVPLDNTTQGMCNDAFFEKMRPGTIFINASSQILIDACDIATPHIAGYSYQGKQNGTAMAVQAIARHFGIKDLEFFSPAMEDALMPKVINVKGKTQGEIAAAVQYNYPIFTDDFLFRVNPSNFEKLRSEYNYRREFYFEP